jgi:hypothetical protein
MRKQRLSFEVPAQELTGTHTEAEALFAIASSALGARRSTAVYLQPIDWRQRQSPQSPLPFRRLVL